MLDEIFSVPCTMSLMCGKFINTNISLNGVCLSPETQTVLVACRHLVRRLANLGSSFLVS